MRLFKLSLFFLILIAITWVASAQESTPNAPYNSDDRYYLLDLRNQDGDITWSETWLWGDPDDDSPGRKVTHIAGEVSNENIALTCNHLSDLEQPIRSTGDLDSVDTSYLDAEEVANLWTNNSVSGLRTLRDYQNLIDSGTQVSGDLPNETFRVEGTVASQSVIVGNRTATISRFDGSSEESEIIGRLLSVRAPESRTILDSTCLAGEEFYFPENRRQTLITPNRLVYTTQEAQTFLEMGYRIWLEDAGWTVKRNSSDEQLFSLYADNSQQTGTVEDEYCEIRIQYRDKLVDGIIQTEVDFVINPPPNEDRFVTDENGAMIPMGMDGNDEVDISIRDAIEDLQNERLNARWQVVENLSYDNLDNTNSNRQFAFLVFQRGRYRDYAILREINSERTEITIQSGVEFCGPTFRVD